MTTADLLEAMNKADILMQSWVLYCNPDDAKELKERIPKTIKLVPISFVDKGTSYFGRQSNVKKNFIFPDSVFYRKVR